MVRVSWLAGQTHLILSTLRLLLEDFLQKADIQGRLITLGPHAALAWMAFEQCYRQPTQQGEILSAVTLLNPAGVLAKRHVQLPMQAILHPPMIAQRRTVSLHTATTAADKITQLARGLAVYRPLAVALTYHRQLLPLLLPANALRLMNQFINTLLLTAMTFFHRLIYLITCPLAVLVIRLDKTSFNVLTQMLLIVLHGQYVIAAASHNLGRNGFLAAHRIDRYQRSLHVQQLQQTGDGLDLVGFLVGGHLAQGQVGLDRPGADQVQVTQR